MNLSSPIESLIPGLRGRVLTALVRSSRPLSVREVARKARSNSHPSVKLVLVSLIDEGVAKYSIVSRGAQYFELNTAHILVPHLVGIDHAKDAMLDAVRAQVATWQRDPRAVVLFGSVARHEDTAASDIDLLIVWKAEHAPSDNWQADKIRLAERVQAFTGNDVNIMDFSGPEWEAAVDAEETVVGEVARDGVSVMGTAVRTLTRHTVAASAR